MEHISDTKKIYNEQFIEKIEKSNFGRYVFFLSVIFIIFFTTINSDVVKNWEIQVMLVSWLVVGLRCSRTSLNDNKWIQFLFVIISIFSNLISFAQFKYFYFKKEQKEMLPILLIFFTFIMAIWTFLVWLSGYKFIDKIIDNVEKPSMSSNKIE